MADQKKSGRGKGGEAVQRETVWGPVVAIITVNKDVEPKEFVVAGEKVPYFLGKRAVKRGILEVSFFGEVKPGQQIVARIELKRRRNAGSKKWINYIRAEKAPEGTKASHKIFIAASQGNTVLDESMPLTTGVNYGSALGKNFRRSFVIGFVKNPQPKAKAA